MPLPQPPFHCSADITTSAYTSPRVRTGLAGWIAYADFKKAYIESVISVENDIPVCLVSEIIDFYKN
ncbi:hypothetical protein ACTXT7_010480 [Hymenolepis weldensis]